jgi:hypothetical protein
VADRDERGLYLPGHGLTPAAPRNMDQVRAHARKTFLDTLNGIDGSVRLLAIARIAEGAVHADGVIPTVREMLDANLALLWMQGGKPQTAVDVRVTNTATVRWDPTRYERTEDLERLIELQKIGETHE